MRTAIALAAALGVVGISDASAAQLCKSVVYRVPPLTVGGAKVVSDPNRLDVLPVEYLPYDEVVRYHYRKKNRSGVWMAYVEDITHNFPDGSPSWVGWMLDEQLSPNFVRCPRT